MKPVPVQDVEQAIMLVEAFSGRAEDFTLAVSDELQDEIGINMALITDHILKKGWEPDGFSQQDGYRLYRYKTPA